MCTLHIPYIQYLRFGGEYLLKSRASREMLCKRCECVSERGASEARSVCSCGSCDSKYLVCCFSLSSGCYFLIQN